VERLGLFGGTFDPVHIGHLVAALAARHQLGLDQVLLVLAPDPWQKRGRVVAPVDARWDMLVAATRGVDGLEPSDVELARDGPTYTMDTVDVLAAADREIVLVLGADAAAGLSTWHRADELSAAVTVAVVRRVSDTAVMPGPPWRTLDVAMPRLDVSSTDIRRRVAGGEPIDFLVPDAAIPVIRERHLYTPQS
jgi:nicotinate-nucleotide adenylyltransferase